MTTVTERRIVGGLTDNRITNITASHPLPSADAGGGGGGASTATASAAEEEAPALPPKESHAAKAMLMMMHAEPPPDPGSLAGILKGGKMWKSETVRGRKRDDIMTVHCTRANHLINRFL